MRLKFIVCLPLTWVVLPFVYAKTGFPRSEWIAVPLWIVSVLLFLGYSQPPERYQNSLDTSHINSAARAKALSRRTCR